MSLQQDLDNLKKIAGDLFKAIDKMKTARPENVSTKPKIIDLSMLVGSDVLCQFSDNDNDWERLYARLKQIDKDSYPFIDDGFGGDWRLCRVAYNHWQAYMTDEQPIPDGYMVELMYDGGIDTEALESSGWAWAEMDIKAYRVTGVADGYIHPWEAKDVFAQDGAGIEDTQKDSEY